MKYLLKKLCYYIYRTGRNYAYQEKKLNYMKSISESLILGQDSEITYEALIQNCQSDKKKITIGNNCRISGHLMIFRHGGNINIGDNCFVGFGTKIWSAKNIQIGDRVLIAHNVNIHDNNSHPLESNLRHLDYLHIKSIGLQEQIDLKEKEIIIEDDVWIGFNSTIYKGVKIGKGAIIGSNSIITKDIEPYSVVAGSPLRVIKHTI